MNRSFFEATHATDSPIEPRGKRRSAGVRWLTCGGWLLLPCLLNPPGLIAAMDAEKLRPFLTEYCLECHDSDTKKGGLDLEKLGAEFGDAANFEAWVKVHDRLRAGEMPPRKKAQPPRADRDAITRWLNTGLTAADAERQKGDGRAGVRRLSRVEFEN